MSTLAKTSLTLVAFSTLFCDAVFGNALAGLCFALLVIVGFVIVYGSSE